MLIKSRTSADVLSSEITSRTSYLTRRRLLGLGGLGLASLSSHVGAQAEERILQMNKEPHHLKSPPWLRQKVEAAVSGNYSVKEKVTPYEIVTQYNNFYEFGTDKSDPYENAGEFSVDPWTIEVSGEAEMVGKFNLEDIVKPHQLEERIYRLRCVEAWSMVIPWVGIPLVNLIKKFKPTSRAKYVRFETIFDPLQMPGQRSYFSSIDWPYVEGLRIDEAANDLAFLALGLYGQTLPPQNGAPLRLVVPWKYGFKSIKSIVKIEFVEKQPKTTWERANSKEYGFYANVNPQVSHPRWSQARERRLPNSLFSPKYVDTLMFNGYADQVAHLYSNMDLKSSY